MSRAPKKVTFTPEQLAQFAAIRARYANRPTLDELRASGDLSGDSMPLGIYLNVLAAADQLKRQREKLGVTLTELAKQSGIDLGALSRLENGKKGNLTIATMARWASALELDLVISFRSKKRRKANSRSKRAHTRVNIEPVSKAPSPSSRRSRARPSPARGESSETNSTKDD